MSDVLIDQDTMEDIGDSIRSKLGVQTTYLPSEMPSAIMSISGGGDTLVIQDASIYSEDEQQIGIWTDGKPLYQKSYLISATAISANTWYAISAVDVTNFETIVKTELHLGGGEKSNNSWGFGRNDNGVFKVFTPVQLFVNIITLQYTKTTDTPGSGGYKAYGLSPIIYSEEEREVGVWTDGKPLYQKTYKIKPSTLVTVSDWAVIDNTINGETLVWQEISVSSSVESRGLAMRTDNTDVVPRFCITDGAFKYYADTNTFPFYNRNWWYITIRYTKTTDTSGSGIWTTTGEYAVHYDGTEKVIGTWFGETLYERSYDLTLSSDFDASGGFLIDNDVSYIKILVSAEGSGKSPEGYITNMGGLAGAQVWQYNVHRNPSNQLVLYSGQSSSAISGGKAAITIRYTKTTS